MTQCIRDDLDCADLCELAVLHGLVLGLVAAREDPSSRVRG